MQNPLLFEAIKFSTCSWDYGKPAGRITRHRRPRTRTKIRRLFQCAIACPFNRNPTRLELDARKAKTTLRPAGVADAIPKTVSLVGVENGGAIVIGVGD